ncbi:hypothetical protein ACFLU6_10835, partial [Acidobacteriota bacterium]
LHGSCLEDIIREPGVPEQESISKSAVKARGVDKKATNATFTAHEGRAETIFAGAYNPSTYDFEGDYELVLGGMKQENSIWNPKYLYLYFEDELTPAYPESYLDSMLHITVNHVGQTEIVPGETINIDHQYCFSQVNLTYRSLAGTFFEPRVRTSKGSFEGIDFLSNWVSYEVSNLNAKGTPRNRDEAANEGLVVMCVPQGSYTLTPFVTSINPGQGTSKTELPEVNFTAGCRQVIELTPDIQLNLNAVPLCSRKPVITLTGSVHSNTKVARISYTLNQGPDVNVCTDCGENPSFSFEVSLVGCENEITVTAEDSQGETASVTVFVSYDQEPPAIVPPEPLIMECTDSNGIPVDDPVIQAWLASASAMDNCNGPINITHNAPDLVPSSCDGSMTTLVTFTGEDLCGNSSLATSTVTVIDSTPPVISGVPPNETVECDAVPPPTGPTATDLCDPAPVFTLNETRTDGRCEDSYTLTRIWAAVDSCGNEASDSRAITVQDTTAPELFGIPADVTVECDSIPEPAQPSVTDNCDALPEITFNEARIDGDCPGEFTLIRTWTAYDDCDNEIGATQVIKAVDTTPPVVEEAFDDLYCLWPPNHWYVCFDTSDFSPDMTDNCSDPITFRFIECVSDQPDDAGGDGSTNDDCVILDDGQTICIRAERSGHDRDGRRYLFSIAATDACENTGEATWIGSIYVPHNHDPAQEDCINTAEAGCKGKEGLPCNK